MDTILKDSPFLSKMKVSLLKSGKKDYGDDNSWHKVDKLHRQIILGENNNSTMTSVRTWAQLMTAEQKQQSPSSARANKEKGGDPVLDE